MTIIKNGTNWLGFVMALFLAAGVTAKAGAQAGGNDSQIQADVTKALDNKRFKDVQVSVQDGVVTLKGDVDVYSAKEDADSKAHHRKNVKAVQNLIEVKGSEV